MAAALRFIIEGEGAYTAVGRNVHHVGRDQQPTRRPQDPFGVAPPHHASQAAPCHHAGAYEPFGDCLRRI